jgi:hypothetical protein
MIKKKHIKIQDKKKLCPNCNGKVFNATVKCKLLINNKSCNHHFISRREANLHIEGDVKKLKISTESIELLFPYKAKILPFIIPSMLVIKLNF